MNLPGFCASAYTSQSMNADAELLMNWYAEQMESPFAKSPVSLYPTPGVSTFLTFPTYPNKALFEMDGLAFAVSGATFYSFTSGGVATARGTVLQDTNLGMIISNGDAGHQRLIAAGNHAYCYDVNSTAFSDVVTGCLQIGYLDGFGLILDANTSTLKCSAFLDFTDWSGAGAGGGGEAQRNAAADRWIAMGVAHRGVWLFGTQTTEVWQDAGTFPFPLAPYGQGAFLEYGIAAAFSIATIADTIIWLSRNQQGHCEVRQSTGVGSSKRISTHAVEFAIQGYSTVSDAEAFAYQDQGHTFYQLTFPTAGATWVYDTVTGWWHQRGFWNTITGQFDAARPRNHAFAFGKHLVGDRITGVLSDMNIANGYDADGALIRRVRRAPTLNDEGLWIHYPAVVVDMQVGIGDLTTTDPQVMWRYSDSQGQTWSNERWCSAGASGDYQKRVRFVQMGRSRSRINEMVVADPVPYRIQGVYLQPDPIKGLS